MTRRQDCERQKSNHVMNSARWMSIPVTATLSAHRDDGLALTLTGLCLPPLPHSSEVSEIQLRSSRPRPAPFSIQRNQ